MRQVLIGVLAAAVLAAGATAATQKGGSLHATLLGKSETPKGDPDGTGTAEVKISGTRSAGRSRPRRSGRSSLPTSTRAGWCRRPGCRALRQDLQGEGLRQLDGSDHAAIQRNPGAYYVNVHNAKYPGGRPARPAAERRLAAASRDDERVHELGLGAPGLAPGAHERVRDQSGPSRARTARLRARGDRTAVRARPRPAAAR